MTTVRPARTVFALSSIAATKQTPPFYITRLRPPPVCRRAPRFLLFLLLRHTQATAVLRKALYTTVRLVPRATYTGYVEDEVTGAWHSETRSVQCEPLWLYFSDYSRDLDRLEVRAPDHLFAHFAFCCCFLFFFWLSSMGDEGIRIR